MFQTMVNGFAAVEEESGGRFVMEGPHNKASKRLKGEISNIARRVRVRRNRRDRTLPKRANLITKMFDERMQISVEKNRAIFFKDPNGIELTHPHGSKIQNLSDLKVITDNRRDSSFNVIVGCQKNRGNESTFVALKVSDRQKKINSEEMLIYIAALRGMLKNKPSVIRGTLRNGVTDEYVCHGYRKNPKGRNNGEYAFKNDVSDLEKKHNRWNQQAGWKYREKGNFSNGGSKFACLCRIR